MNLGNQNSKYSWRIRDLENPQTGTQFANSVLMYKIGVEKKQDLAFILYRGREKTRSRFHVI